LENTNTKARRDEMINENMGLVKKPERCLTRVSLTVTGRQTKGRANKWRRRERRRKEVLTLPHVVKTHVTPILKKGLRS